MHYRFGHFSIESFKIMARKVLMEGLPTKIPDLVNTCPICLFTKATKIYRVSTIDVSKFPLVSCFRWILRFSVLKASVGLPRLLWLYALLIHTPLYFRTEANVHLVTSSNFLSLNWRIRIIKLHSYGLINMNHLQDLLNSWTHVATCTS